MEAIHEQSANLADAGPPASGESGSFAPLERVEFLRSYYFIFDSPQWFNVMLAATLAVLASQVIPFVPYIVLAGYMLMVIEWQITHDEGPFPTFAFDRFTDYLSRGVWPFLIALPFMGLYFVLYLISYFGGVFGLIAMAQTSDEETIGLTLSIGIPVLVLFWMGLLMSTGILSSAMMLRAGLSRSFREAFRIGWLWDFFRRTWMEQLLAFSFVMIGSLFMSFLGVLALCFGYFVTIAWTILAYGQLWGQLYRVYLTRGGDPIPPPRPTGPRPIEAPLAAQTPAGQPLATGAGHIEPSTEAVPPTEGYLPEAPQRSDLESVQRPDSAPAGESSNDVDGRND